MTLAIPEQLWRTLQGTIRADGVETAGIALAYQQQTHGGRRRFLLAELHLPQSCDYLEQAAYGAVLTPAFVASVVRQARDRRMSVVFFHTHPFADRAHFSRVDDAGERPLLGFVDRRVPGLQHAALVLGQRGHSARLLGSTTLLPIEVIGPALIRFDTAPAEEPARGDDPGGDFPDDFDRQVRVFGPAGQRRLSSLRVAIVGLGGTGSLLAQQLAHLGVNDFVLVDPDVLEATNLNRVAGAAQSDIGRPKVEVGATMIRGIRAGVKVEALHADVVHNSVLAQLRGVGAIFCCTDSHGSRYVLNEIAYRFLIPCFDCGVVIAASGGTISHIAGRVQMLSPGLACLTCTRVLDPEQVRRDLLSDFERKQDPYILGGGAPQPAVMSLNGVVVSLLVTMFLGAVAGVPVSPRYQLYDAIRGTVRAVDSTPTVGCVTCSTEGALAVGDTWPLPGRGE